MFPVRFTEQNFGSLFVFTNPCQVISFHISSFTIYGTDPIIIRILNISSNFSTFYLLLCCRKCRVNAALTIQLFSQLFHFVNMWTFNTIVSDLSKTNYCTHKWGLRLKRRLARIEIWAEKQVSEPPTNHCRKSGRIIRFFSIRYRYLGCWLSGKSSIRPVHHYK